MSGQANVAADIPAHVDPALVVDFDYFADHRYRERARPMGADQAVRPNSFIDETKAPLLQAQRRA